MELVLVEPEIPPNAGNVARLCAVTGTRLHLVEPLGFRLEDRHLKRAGLDYWPNVEMSVWPDFGAFRADLLSRNRTARLVLTSSKPGGTQLHRFAFREDDVLVFGSETRGLPRDVLALSDLRVRIPMLRGGGRCLNLSTSCGVVLYAALASAGVLDGEEWDA